MKWQFKEGAPVQVNSDGFWFGINEGSINLEKVLEGQMLVHAKLALAMLNSLASAMENEGLLVGEM